MIESAFFILYVADQNKSARFYEAVLGVKPILDVPGMTEFALTNGGTLGIMPAAGIKRLLGESLPDPSKAAGTPTSELYLMVDDASVYHGRAVASGAKELSELKLRDWGDRVAYSLDLEGHVLAFAEWANEDSERVAG